MLGDILWSSRPELQAGVKDRSCDNSNPVECFVRLSRPCCHDGNPVECLKSSWTSTGDCDPVERQQTSDKESARGLFSAKVPHSSCAEVRVELFIEPTHMEDEDEDQEIEKEDERDGEECRVESRRVSRQQHADDTWMTCAQDT